MTTGKRKASSPSSQSAVIDQSALEEVFRNNPLKQVAFEMRFPRKLAVIRDVSDMQEKLGPQFAVTGPETLLSPGDQSTIITYNFSNPPENLLIKVGEDRFAIVFTKYQKFEVFKAKSITIAQQFINRFKINQLRRVGLRYVNNIALPPDGQRPPITRYLRPYVDVARMGDVNQFSLELLSRKDSYFLNTRCALLIQPVLKGKVAAVYVLDLDAYITNEINPRDLSNTLDQLHYQVQIEFLTHITEEYKQVMRGKK